ncbi:hypothetical protein [Rubidibacter lacunae]|nr:hypothetical protein [Rubidibacter lacunae]
MSDVAVDVGIINPKTARLTAPTAARVFWGSLLATPFRLRFCRNGWQYAVEGAFYVPNAAGSDRSAPRWRFDPDDIVRLPADNDYRKFFDTFFEAYQHWSHPVLARLREQASKEFCLFYLSNEAR